MATPELIMALSLWQPWATLMAIGAKHYETRSWPTRYRGPLAIHASLRLKPDQVVLFVQEPFRSVLHAAGISLPSQLPSGAFVATGRLVNCIRTEEIDARLSDQERAFGDYTPGRWAWILADIHLLSTPVPARGQQGLWDCTEVLYQ